MLFCFYGHLGVLDHRTKGYYAEVAEVEDTMKKRVMIFGASGGIGAALCSVLTADLAIECVYAGGRISSRVPQGDRIRPFSFLLGY